MGFWEQCFQAQGNAECWKAEKRVFSEKTKAGVQTGASTGFVEDMCAGSCWREGNKVEQVTPEPGLRGFKNQAEFVLEEEGNRKLTPQL